MSDSLQKAAVALAQAHHELQTATTYRNSALYKLYNAHVSKDRPEVVHGLVRREDFDLKLLVAELKEASRRLYRAQAELDYREDAFFKAIVNP